MPHRKVVAKKLGRLLSSVSHPARIRIIAELKDQELCVSELRRVLDTTSSGVSHHLSVLKSMGVAKERREGHHVYYSLVSRDFALWLIDGVRFLEPDATRSSELTEAIRLTQSTWLGSRELVSS